MTRHFCGDIGEPVRRVEFEPMPEHAPAEPQRETTPQIAPREPVPA